MDLKAAQGAQVSSRVKWVEDGESSSAYFFRLKKKRGLHHKISAWRTSDGTIVSDTSGLNDVVTSFYSNLFCSKLTDAGSRASLLRNVGSSLPSEDVGTCEGLLTPEECHAALPDMARRKAPGSDGLPMEFYLKFWDLLGEDLVCVLNSCFCSGRLSHSQCRGVISLSFKKGDRLDMGNWRPISLLNVDYKLAARAISGRLLKIIHLVVEKDQMCGARLNESKSKDLWLGSWVGWTDPPVALDWSSTKLKFLGVYLGLGNLEEANSHLPIDAV